MNVKTLAMMLAAALSAAPILAAAGEALDSEIPVVMKESVDRAPAAFAACGSTARAHCSKDSGGWPPSETCDVVKYKGLTYWPMSFDDSRHAILAAGFDETNAPTRSTLIKSAYLSGPRYIWKVDVKPAFKEVRFWGQGVSKALVTWTKLTDAKKDSACK